VLTRQYCMLCSRSQGGCATICAQATQPGGSGGWQRQIRLQNHRCLRSNHHMVSAHIGSMMGWDLAEWLERCANIPNITGSNPSGGSELTFCSDLLLTARGSST
jgi:hypothetical protein